MFNHNHPLLESEKFYHIYNRTNGDENLFRDKRNYTFFLEKYEQHINPVAETFAYCLMPNHFHFLVKIKCEDDLNKISHSSKFPCLENLVSKHFSNLFSSYTQAFNKVYDRKGSLFLKNFKRKEIIEEDYLCNIVIYIHCNPVYHGFVEKLNMWEYSSYHLIVSKGMKTKIKKEVIEWFDSLENFNYCHQEAILTSPKVTFPKFETLEKFILEKLEDRH